MSFDVENRLKNTRIMSPKKNRRASESHGHIAPLENCRVKAGEHQQGGAYQNSGGAQTDQMDWPQSSCGEACVGHEIIVQVRGYPEYQAGTGSEYDEQDAGGEKSGKYRWK